jgi:hypothetical protein
MYTIVALDFAAFDMAKAYSDDLRCKLLTAYESRAGVVASIRESGAICVSGRIGVGHPSTTAFGPPQTRSDRDADCHLR